MSAIQLDDLAELFVEAAEMLDRDEPHDWTERPLLEWPGDSVDGDGGSPTGLGVLLPLSSSLVWTLWACCWVSPV